MDNSTDSLASLIDWQQGLRLQAILEMIEAIHWRVCWMAQYQMARDAARRHPWNGYDVDLED